LLHSEHAQGEAGSNRRPEAGGANTL
jgi:hypothetical protein